MSDREGSHASSGSQGPELEGFPLEDAPRERVLGEEVPVGLSRLRETRLFARAAEGDRDAIAEVWRLNRRWIASVLVAHAPRSADIDDLLQDVASTLVAKSHHIRDAASLRGWLRVVAVNAARMAARAKSVESRALRGLATGLGDHSGREEAERATRETLALLAKLPAQYAEPLLLQAAQGLSQRQIAELLDVPETTVENRLARGRRMLRHIAQELESDTAPATTMNARDAQRTRYS